VGKILADRSQERQPLAFRLQRQWSQRTTNVVIEALDEAQALTQSGDIFAVPPGVNQKLRQENCEAKSKQNVV
jgi:hypothetical protein